jgi:hypothetical protein
VICVHGGEAGSGNKIVNNIEGIIDNDDVYNEKHLDLFIYLREFGTFGYGFGLPKDSPFTLQFSISILELRQKDYITTLKQKWLRGQCDSTDSSQGQ